MNSNNTLKLTQAISMLRRVHIRSLKLTDMDHREFHLLKTIALRKADGKDTSIGDLVNLYHISKPAISNLIKKTEEKGFVERNTDKADRRVVWVRLTDSGRVELERQARYWEDLGEKIEAKFGEQNIDLFITLINRLAEVVEEIIEEEHSDEKPDRRRHK